MLAGGTVVAVGAGAGWGGIGRAAVVACLGLVDVVHGLPSVWSLSRAPAHRFPNCVRVAGCENMRISHVLAVAGAAIPPKLEPRARGAHGKIWA